MSDLRVVLADDHALLRDSFRLLLDNSPGFTVVGEAATGAEAVDVCRRERPDVVLMDVRMPGTDGIEATRRICRDPATTGVRVLVLTTFDLDEYVYAALHAGASGFLVKDTGAADLLAAVRVVAAGESLLSPSVTRRLIASYVGSSPPSPALTGRRTERLADRRTERLTAREREVLTLIARGRSNAELAAELHLSPGTVKTHIGRLLSKLQARDRAQLVILAYETGLISPRS